MVRPIGGLTTTIMATLSKWLQGELSKQRLDLTYNLMAYPRRR